jgi:hypothetical protein
VSVVRSIAASDARRAVDLLLRYLDAIRPQLPPRAAAETTDPAIDQAQLLSPLQVARVLGVGATKFGQLAKEAGFPRPIVLGAGTKYNRSIKYRLKDVVAWIDTREPRKVEEPPQLRQRRLGAEPRVSEGKRPSEIRTANRGTGVLREADDHVDESARSARIDYADPVP